MINVNKYGKLFINMNFDMYPRWRSMSVGMLIPERGEGVKKKKSIESMIDESTNNFIYMRTLKVDSDNIYQKVAMVWLPSQVQSYWNQHRTNLYGHLFEAAKKYHLDNEIYNAIETGKYINTVKWKANLKAEVENHEGEYNNNVWDINNIQKCNERSENMAILQEESHPHQT